MSSMMGTIITGFALLALVAAIVLKLIRDRRNGRQCAGCGCGEQGCPAALNCYVKK